MTADDAATHVRAVLAARHALDALPHHALGDATRILSALAGASPDEREIVALVAEGLASGRPTYGPLDLATDPRDLLREGLEEARDQAVYATAAWLRLVRLDREVRGRWPGA